MGCQLILFSFLVTSCALVDSFPYPESNRDGQYRLGDQQSNRLFYQPNINPLWPSQGIAQSTPNPILVWNQPNYKDSEIQQIDRNNFARPANAYGFGQVNNYDNVTPVATVQNGFYPQWPNILPQQSTPAPQSAINGLPEGWWNNQPPQNNQFYGRPFQANSFGQSYATPYVNQGNYAQGFSQYQSAGLVTPKPIESFNNGQGWLAQKQYNYIPTSTPVEYLAWPVPNNEKVQPTEPTLPNENNVEPENSPSPGTTPPSVEEPDNPQPIVTSLQPVKIQKIVPKHYIIVHMNETYERIDNLDDIEVDENNVAHIKSKPHPNHVLAIIEIEETVETENQNQTGETEPYDTGITKIPRDTEWNTNDNGNSGTLQNYKYPLTQETTEDTTYDMKYFKPEYIMPILSTTENTIDSTTNFLPQTTTNSNNDPVQNSFAMQSTTKNSIVSSTDSAIDSTTSSSNTDNITEITTDSPAASTTDNTIDSNTKMSTPIFTDKSQYSTTEDTNYRKHENLFTTQTTEIPQFDDNYFDYYEDNDDTEESKYKTPNTKTFILKQISRIDKEKKRNNIDDFATIQSSNLPQRTVHKRGYENDKPLYYEQPGQTSNDDYKEQAGESTTASASSAAFETKNDPKNENDPENDKSPSTQRSFKLRDDLKIDVSDLKTVVDKPVVWFRPDIDFWDKVTKGEQAFDAVSFYDVNCKPKLIEKLTTIHHYANGTQTIDYVEIIWDSEDDVSPREVNKSKQEIRQAE